MEVKTDVKDPKKKPEFHPLTDARCKALKYGDKPIFDGRGLYLDAMKNRKVWRFKAKLKNGKPILMTLGAYPSKTVPESSSLTLAQARNRREELRELIAQGKDPRKVIESQEKAERERLTNTLRHVTGEWLQVRSDKVAEKTNKVTESTIRRYVFPMIGEKPIADITPQDVMAVLRDAEKTSTYMPHKIKALLARVFSYAIQIGIGNNNPAAAIVSKDVLKKHITKHHKTISLAELPGFLKAIGKDAGSIQAKSALWLAMLMFTRKMEACKAEWSHIDLKAALWTIPSGNKKERRDQVHPLPRQAVEILKKLQVYTGGCRFVFNTGQGRKSNDAPLGEKTLNTMLDRMGYHGKMTPHGLRALASTYFDELRGKDGGKRFSREAVERQLSHKEEGQTNQAYHRADYMAERREMLQAWADYLESLIVDTTDTEESLQTARKAA